MRFLSADYVFPISSPVIPEGIVAVKENGCIEGVYTAGQLPSDLLIEKYKGIICPGFVNAHCHLELSYLKGKIQPQTRLMGFIDELLKKRHLYDKDTILKCAAEADKTMFENGINAAGDISNNADSFTIKTLSSISYHTFIEVYDFLEERADEAFEKGKELMKQYPSLRKSLTPHATYSVTQPLVKKILSGNAHTPLSIHHDETESEMELLEKGTGKLAVFFQQFFSKNFSLKEGITSIQNILELVKDEQPLLLVHNTYSNAETMERINKTRKNIFWCFCPKANLYIENRLPDFKLFELTDNCCLGTDSLASNDTLCILEEIKTILRYYPEISTEKLLKWATLNGAKALLLENQFGSFEKNKNPGILLIEKTEGENITQESRVKRLI